MPPIRSKKTEYRRQLYLRVESHGIEIAPCSRCERQEKKCIIATDSNRCSECIKAGGSVKCDVHGPSVEDWKTLEHEETKLMIAWQETQVEQRRLLDCLLAQQAKLVELDKQRATFRTRAAEMLRRGLNSIAELDALEEADRQVFNVSLAPAGPSDDIDISCLDPFFALCFAEYSPNDPFGTLELPSSESCSSVVPSLNNSTLSW